MIRLQVDHLPAGKDPPPLWLWSSKTGMTGDAVDLRRQAFLRRFDLEHTFRMIKQTLGRTRPKLRTPEAADRWTWLVPAGGLPAAGVAGRGVVGGDDRAGQGRQPAVVGGARRRRRPPASR
ncbi:hypothetical protein ACIHCQ_39310 [Streptomyces sp. NPDC052236]|uniref:hypothetical protein n=1 Tax=Streptomyces sp. NPDC052236 TaxID=3365686 RepID=UPI0037CD1911